MVYSQIYLYSTIPRGIKAFNISFLCLFTNGMAFSNCPALCSSISLLKLEQRGLVEVHLL